jgi:hypothetical protein
VSHDTLTSSLLTEVFCRKECHLVSFNARPSSTWRGVSVFSGKSRL